MSEIYSIDFINPGEVDAISDDKVIPPAYRTVQNKQPIPAGTIYKRNAIPSTQLVSAAANLDTQLISPIDIKGIGSEEIAIAAVSEVTSTTCTFYKYDSGWGVLGGGGLTTTAEDGIYYVTNAIDSSNVNQLIAVKYSPNAEVCCYAFDKDYAQKTFDANGTVNIRTLNWRSSACASFHQGKLWVGGLNEHDYSTFVAPGGAGLIDEDLDATEVDVTVDASHGVVAHNLIRVDNEDMYVSSVATNVLTVVRGVNGSIATTHENNTAFTLSTGSASQKRNRVRWSKTFNWDSDISSWTGAGTGYMDFPVIGEIPAVVGLQSFKNRLYVLTNSDLYVISGETSAQYGKHEVVATPGAIGTTLKKSEKFMFWVDADGIHQFNGVEEVNVSDKLKPIAFEGLNVEGYNIDGVGREGRLPTAFVNDKLGIYGIHFPKTTACSGEVSWLYYYRRGTIETYTYSYLSNLEDITYVSDYHPSGKVWMGTGNVSSNIVYGGLYPFEPVNVAANAENDWAGSNGISTVIDTGDINIAALNGGSYDDATKINRIDVYYVPDVAQDVTLKMDVAIDGTIFDDAVTRTTATLAKDTAGKLAPVRVTMPLPSLRTGSFVRIKLTEDDSNGKVSIRRMDIYYTGTQKGRTPIR